MLADVRQQHCRFVAGSVLGLRNQVGGDPFGMRAVVGDHQHLARSRHLVDIGDAINHPLGGLHVRVAGPDDLVHRRMVSVPYASAATACAPPTR